MNHELNHFLSGIEKKAFRMARLATRDTDHALDVQDTMMLLAQKYASNNQQD